MQSALGLRALVFVVCLLTLATPRAQEPAAVPPLGGRVSDLVGVIDPAARQRLEQRLAAVEAARGSQIAVLIVDSTQPEPIEAYSIRVVDAWQLGRAEVDDGLLVLVATTDRRMRLEVGRGLEGAIPDAIARRIIDERMVPAFRRGDMAGGLMAAIEAIDLRLAGEDLPAPGRQRAAESGGAIETLVIFGLFAAMFLGSILRGVFGRLLGSGIAAALVGAGAWWFTGIVSVGVIAAVLTLLFVLSMGRPGSTVGRGGHWGGGGGWSSGGGGGPWSGGGGGFGGGGASGRW